MKRFALSGLVVAVLAIVIGSHSIVRAQQPEMKMPTPTKEHEWLGQLVGEWDSDMEAVMQPGQPPMKCKGTESVRKLGGFWVIGQGQGEMMGMKVQSVMTLGYDVNKKKYVGTWVDSMQNHMWKYEGTVDEAGKVLTLETEGPNMMTGGMSKFRDVIEVKGKDQKELRSMIQMPDGKWFTFATAKYTRKAAAGARE